MDRHIVIVTSDKRQEILADMLEGERVSCAWAENAKEKQKCEKIYILPTPVTKIDRNKEIKEKLKQELITESENELVKISVFGGMFQNEWKEFFCVHEISYWDFMKMADVVEGNAWITAEATVSEVLQHGKYSIFGQKVLVTGYGCCGEKIAKIFSKLGADVTVVARREEIRQKAREDGYRTVDFKEMNKCIGGMNTVINTVPAMVLSEESIRRMSKDTLVIDIASKPGGTDFEAAKKYGIQARLALGLPGIYTTTSSAKLLKNAVSKYAPLQDDGKGDRQWIFQIII